MAVYVLFLDDSEDRINSLKKFHGDYFSQVDVARTASEAIQLLEKNPDKYNIIRLDHDLGGSVFQDSTDKNSGMEVVRFMVKSTLNRTIPIVIHSWNIPAATQMRLCLLQAGFITVAIVPFSYES